MAWGGHGETDGLSLDLGLTKGQSDPRTWGSRTAGHKIWHATPIRPWGGVVQQEVRSGGPTTADVVTLRFFILCNHSFRGAFGLTAFISTQFVTRGRVAAAVLKASAERSHNQPQVPFALSF